MREVEAKFRITDVETLLVALKAHGVELGPAVMQDDQAYAPAGWRYGQSKIGVPFARLRTEAGRLVFTVKPLLRLDFFQSGVKPVISSPPRRALPS